MTGNDQTPRWLAQAPAPSPAIRKRAAVFGSVCVFAFVLLLAGAAAAEGGIDKQGPVLSLGAGLTVLFATLALAVVLGMPLFVIIGLIATSCFMFLSEDFNGFLTLDRLSDTGAEMMSKEVLLAIPFFVASGSIMSVGGIARRLVDVARALVGWMPGGLAIATVASCVVFAAISGSSPVTVIAIGSMMYPRLVDAGYTKRFSLGVVSSAGSLGILIPPSIPMLVYAIVASSSGPIDVAELFLAGVLPGLMIGVLLALLAPFNAKNVERERFEFKVLVQRIREGAWALSLPAVILGGIYTGVFTATEAAAISVVYALIVELLIHRDISPQDIPKILTESVVNMGTILIIMLLAFGLNAFLVEEMIPQKAVAWILDKNLTPVTFLLLINLLLLLVGALMDSISAILIIAPLLAPIGIELGIDPIHLGIIFIVNLEIGYLTPPIGINLFVASSVFRQPLGEVVRGVVPFIGMMLIGLVAVTYVPSIALGPVNKILREKDFYEPFPEAREVHVAIEGDESSDEDVVGDAFKPVDPPVGKDGKKVKSIAEMMAENETEDAEESEGDEDDEESEDGKESEGTEDTEDEPKPVFDSKGMNLVPPDPDEE